MADEINADAVKEEMRAAVERVRRKFGEAAQDAAKRQGDEPLEAENAASATPSVDSEA